MNLTKLNIVFVSVIVLAAGAFSAGFLFPGLRELNVERDRIAQELGAAAKMQTEVGDITKLYEGLMNLKESEESLWYQIPMEPRLGQLQGQLSTLAEAAGIHDAEILSQSPLDVDPSRLPVELRLAASLTVQPVVVKFEGRFDQLIGYLASIEKMERLVRVDSLKVLNSERTPGRLMIEIVLHAYHRRMA